MTDGKQLLCAGLERLSRALNRGIEQLDNLNCTARFFRGALRFAPRDDDIYVVSYPRSGTTWVQFILYQLVSDGRMDFTHLSEVSPWYERSMAQEILDARDFEAFASPRILKSHLLPARLPDRGRFVYVSRDPLDTAQSYYQFYTSHLGFTGSFEAFFERMAAGRVQYGAWGRHVSEWRETDKNAVLHIRYEELIDNREVAIRKIADFCNLPLDDETMNRVMERTTFSYMKSHEEKFDHITSLLLEKGLRRGAFIRSGKTGEGARADSAGEAAQRRERLSRSFGRGSSLLHLSDFLH